MSVRGRDWLNAGKTWLAATRAAVALVAGFAGTVFAQEQVEPGWNFEEFPDDDPGWVELLTSQAPDLALFAGFAVLVYVGYMVWFVVRGGA